MMCLNNKPGLFKMQDGGCMESLKTLSTSLQQHFTVCLYLTWHMHTDLGKGRRGLRSAPPSWSSRSCSCTWALPPGSHCPSGSACESSPDQWGTLLWPPQLQRNRTCLLILVMLFILNTCIHTGDLFTQLWSTPSVYLQLYPPPYFLVFSNSNIEKLKDATEIVEYE